MRGPVAGVLLLAAVGHAADGDWERLGERDGIAIERRTTAGSPIRELRFTTHSPVPPPALLATIWKHQEYPQFVPYLERLDVLRDDGDSKLIYEQIGLPLLKDRDVTLRVTRTTSAEGVREVTSVAVPDEGPPESGDHVRVRTSRSLWQLAPTDDGGTAVTYRIGTDAGGGIPAWILDRIQRDAAVKVLRAMLERARRTNP
ncbi:MAG TPA: START domain-containing protein [Candidatus Binatia bacterium]|nr:START domain-containing protein [Candidatus Binatia bacterium]